MVEGQHDDPGKAMALLDDVIEANGGWARWSELTRFTLQISIKGTLLSDTCEASRFKDIVAEGCTRKQLVRLTGFDDSGKSGVYQPNNVTIEDESGNIQQSWPDPHKALGDQAETAARDELHLIFLCGFSVWHYLMTPFLLSRPGTKVQELSPWREAGQVWRRLTVAFPSNLFPHSPDQTFYFDQSGLQRRVDHILYDTKVAHYSWAHQAFNGIVIPTLRRSLALRPDGSADTKSALMEVEIFDATFR